MAPLMDEGPLIFVSGYLTFPDLVILVLFGRPLFFRLCQALLLWFFFFPDYPPYVLCDTPSFTFLERSPTDTMYFSCPFPQKGGVFLWR